MGRSFEFTSVDNPGHKLSVYFTADMFDNLSEIARRVDRSRSWVLRKAFERFMNDLENEKEKMRHG